MDRTATRMPEAEVSFRLAHWLVATGRATGEVDVALDGAQVRIGGRIHFAAVDFMGALGWQCEDVSGGYRGTFTHPHHRGTIRVHAAPGQQDVVARLADGRRLRVECKKGPLGRSPSSAEYPLLREALGQLLTLSAVEPDDALAVAVPDSPRFAELTAKWRQAPLVVRCGLRLLTVSRNGDVGGLD